VAEGAGPPGDEQHLAIENIHNKRLSFLFDYLTRDKELHSKGMTIP